MPAPLELHAGTVLRGRYRVDRELRSDGTSVVVQATRTSTGERVALKILRAAIGQGGELKSAFLEQGHNASRLRCEHSVRVLEVAELDSGEPYLAMEYLRGTDLARLITEQGPLPTGTAVDYCLQACAALAEAHAWGLAHGEVKPSKFFLATDSGGLARIKLLELGLLRRSGAEVSSDVMAVGVALQYLLTGTVAREQTVAGLPGPLQAVISGCLLKDSAHCYPDVVALARALEPFRDPDGLGTEELVFSTQRAAMQTLPPGRPSPFRDPSRLPTAPEVQAATAPTDQRERTIRPALRAVVPPSDKPRPPVPTGPGAMAATLPFEPHARSAPPIPMEDKSRPPVPTGPELRRAPLPEGRPGPPVPTLAPGEPLSSPGVASPGGQAAEFEGEPVQGAVGSPAAEQRSPPRPNGPSVTLVLVVIALAAVLMGLASVLLWRRLNA